MNISELNVQTSQALITDRVKRRMVDGIKREAAYLDGETLAIVLNQLLALSSSVNFYAIDTKEQITDLWNIVRENSDVEQIVLKGVHDLREEIIFGQYRKGREGLSDPVHWSVFAYDIAKCCQPCVIDAHYTASDLSKYIGSSTVETFEENTKNLGAIFEMNPWLVWVYMCTRLTPKEIAGALGIYKNSEPVEMTHD